MYKMCAGENANHRTKSICRTVRVSIWRQHSSTPSETIQLGGLRLRWTLKATARQTAEERRPLRFRICETINNTVGNDVDKPFISMFPVNAERFFLNLSSHRGSPTLDLSGTTTIDGKERKIQSTVKDGEKVLRLTNPNIKTSHE